MPDQNLAIFDTAIGPCAIVWGERGLLGVQIPEASEAATRARMAKRFPNALETAPPAEIENVIEGMRALSQGASAGILIDVAIDDDGVPDFNRRVYAIVRKVPPGATITYGEIAERLGDKALARAVGQAMGENRCPIVMPCHRVLAASGKSGGFSAPGGVVTKLKLLTIEGAQPGGPTLFDALPLEARR